MASKYSLYGSAAFDARVDADLAHIVRAVRSSTDGDKIHSIILLGGYGRGEGTPLRIGKEETPFNDYDLIVVTNHPSERFVQQMHQLEKTLTEQLSIAVDLYPLSLSSLKHAESSLLNYEMQKGHQVIWGAKNALAVMPKIPIEQVSLNEGTRLLLNRGKLLLDIQCRLDPSNALIHPLTEQEILRFRKFLWKNHLAFGDCALLVLNQYDVLYRVKEMRIKPYKDSHAIPDASWMVSAYLRAIDFKHQGRLELLPEFHLATEWQRTRDYWLSFLLWFEEHRLRHKLNSIEEYSTVLPRSEKKS